MQAPGEWECRVQSVRGGSDGLEVVMVKMMVVLSYLCVVKVSLVVI